MTWSDFCGALDLGALVPDEFARYRPAIVAGLGFFLENLPPGRTAAILAGQAALPVDAGPDERLVAIARHCPALHKLGQVLARDRRLPLRFRRLLQGLESMRPAEDLERIRARLEGELGPLSRLGVDLDGEPLAEASVAVVVPFARRDRPAGHGRGVRRGVFKLLKPGVEAKLAEELRLLRRVGALLDERCDRYGIPRIDYEGTLAEVGDLLRHEVRLEAEQAHLRAARCAYRGVPSVLVPRLDPALSTPRVTAMERVDGVKVTDADALPGPARRRLADTVAAALIARPVWSAGAAPAMFHADPHAGNLLVTPDRRLAILDWSLVGALAKRHRIGLAQVLLGALALDARRVGGAIRGLAVGDDLDAGSLRRVVADNLDRLRRPGARPGLAWLTGLMDGAATAARVRFEPDLLMFRKALQTVEGVIADVSAASRVDLVLAASFLTRLAFESAPRALAPPFWRGFGTHVSNADLARVWLSAPLAAARHRLGPRPAGGQVP